MNSFVRELLGENAVVLQPVNESLEQLEDLLMQLCHAYGERTFLLPNGRAQLRLTRAGQPTSGKPPNVKPAGYSPLTNWFLQGMFYLHGHEPFLGAGVHIAVQKKKDSLIVGLVALRPEFQEFVDELAAELRILYPECDGLQQKQAEEEPSQSASTPAKRKLPDRPPIPKRGDYTWDDVFDWYYRTATDTRPILSALAAAIDYSLSAVEKNKANYVAQHGENRLPDYLSKFTGKP